MELTDYGGKWDPNITFQSFSKEILVELLEQYRTLLLTHDGMWSTAVSERYGINAGIKCGEAAWKMYAPIEMKKIREVLNVQGNDVETFLKVSQFTPSSSLNAYDLDIELKNARHAIMTFTRCKNLEWMEQHAPERVAPICQRMEPPLMKAYGQTINPRMRVEVLKLPPRKSRDEIACQWEIKLEE